MPSQCARRLAEGEADIGLIPVIEYQRIPGLRVIPGIGIASREEVRSVLFVSSRPIHEVTRVAVDTSSRTSVALLQILLQEFYGCRGVQFTPSPPDPRAMLSDFEAALLIGNPALQSPRLGLYVYDLAREWHRFTGLPFVFAFWAVREEVAEGSLTSLFQQTLEEGLAAVPFISEWYSSRLPLSALEIRKYLTRNLEYRLDNRCLEGLGRFYELACQCGILQAQAPVRFL